MNLNLILSEKETDHRSALFEHVRDRESFDLIKLRAYIAAIEEFHGINHELRSALHGLNHHMNKHLKPLHGRMMGEPMQGSVRNKKVKK